MSDSTGRGSEGTDITSDYDTPPHTTPRRLSRRARVLIGVGVFLAVAYLVPAGFTFHPRACATCHAMAPYYETWAASRHRGAADTCLHCHAKPGVVNRTIYRATMYKDIVSTLSGGRIQLFEPNQVTDQSCRQAGCHSLNRVFSIGGQLRINHRLHVEERAMRCIDCHPGAGHEGVRGTSVPPMDSCAECHQEQMDECRYCHVGRSLPTRSDGE